MPTKTRSKTAKLETEIAALEEQLERALAQIRESEAELSGAGRRREAIALDVLSEEPAAVTEDAELEELTVRAAGRLRIARSAVAQAEERITAARGRLDEEHRRAHRERADELGRERHALEEQLEERMAGLVEGLEALRDLDRRQRVAYHQAGDQDAYSRHVLGPTLSSWLSARLGGHRGYLPVAAQDWYRDHTLAQVDHLAKKPVERD